MDALSSCWSLGQPMLGFQSSCASHWSVWAANKQGLLFWWNYLVQTVENKGKEGFLASSNRISHLWEVMCGCLCEHCHFLSCFPRPWFGTTLIWFVFRDITHTRLRLSLSPWCLSTWCNCFFLKIAAKHDWIWTALKNKAIPQGINLADSPACFSTPFLQENFSQDLIPLH